MIKVIKDEEFPADIVLLKSDKDSGIVFVDTMNLDGEVGYTYCYWVFIIDKSKGENVTEGDE